MNIKDHFPRASKSFIDANPVFAKGTFGDVLLQQGDKNAVQPIVATRRGIMNKTETEFAMILEAMKRKGEILRYEFEGITLRFAGVRYTPDFVVLEAKITELGADLMPVKGNAFLRIKFIEVKGPFIKGNRERAVERFRHAKTYWPEFTFEMHQKTKEGWKQII
jgi:hypothetical protein